MGTCPWVAWKCLALLGVLWLHLYMDALTQEVSIGWGDAREPSQSVP
jgi:hypothetical protein